MKKQIIPTAAFAACLALCLVGVEEALVLGGAAGRLAGAGAGAAAMRGFLLARNRP